MSTFNFKNFRGLYPRNPVKRGRGGAKGRGGEGVSKGWEAPNSHSWLRRWIYLLQLLLESRPQANCVVVGVQKPSLFSSVLGVAKPGLARVRSAPKPDVPDVLDFTYQLAFKPIKEPASRYLLLLLGRQCTKISRLRTEMHGYGTSADGRPALQECR